MLYPQITGEPNFILIGISAVFGLLIIIIVYYIVVSKSNTPGRLYIGGSTNTQALQKNTNYLPTQPTPINTGGYYAPVQQSISLPTTSNQNNKQQVFNIKENIYAMSDAAGVCGALGAEVATIDQLIDAHKNGADWCNVGWTKDGIAAYPIQYSTWKTLQGNNPQTRNICGQPGINLVRNDPELLYGVNCYGVKPEPKNDEKLKHTIQSDEQIALNAKIAQFRKNLNAIGVVPFNQDKWFA